jgi:hypothetical protein
MDVMSDLFVAADRLMHNATDADGVLSLVERAEDARRLPLPYGFEPAVWRGIVAEVTALQELIEGDDIADDAIEAQATVVRSSLRDLV